MVKSVTSPLLHRLRLGSNAGRLICWPVLPGGGSCSPSAPHSFTSPSRLLPRTFSNQPSLSSDHSAARFPVLSPRLQIRSLATMAPITSSPMETVDQLVAANRVMIFSKTTCPFCTKIKNLFEQLKVKVEVLELDQIGDGAAVQAALLEKTG